MGLPTKPVLVGVTLGAAAAILAMTAFADELAAPGFDRSKLVTFDDTLFSVSTDPSVSTQAIKTEYVRKIEFGRTSIVKVTTTSSGTYSTDGLYSPHVRYPGIRVEQVSARGEPAQNVAFWSNQSGWVVARLVDADSMLSLGD